MPAVTSHAQPLPALPSKTIVRIELTEDIYDHYVSSGSLHGRTPEQEIAERLKRCQGHTAIRPLYFDDDGRAAIEKATGHLAITEAQVLTRMAKLLSLTVDKVSIALPPGLQERIRTRLFKKPYKEVVAREVIAGLERFVGLRPA